MFSSIAGRLAQAVLCSIVSQDGWPRLVCVQLYYMTSALAGFVFVMAGPGWLVFSSIAGQMA